MKFAAFTSGYQRRTLQDAFRDAQAFGYDGIEICGCRPHAYAYDLYGERLDHIRRLSDRYQMPIIGYCPKVNGYPFNLMVGEKDIFEDCIAYIRRTMDASADMGAGFTLIAFGHAGDLADEQQIRRRIRTSLTLLGEYAAKRQHLLVIEPLSDLETNTITTARQLQEALNEVNCPYLAGMCDTVVPFLHSRQGRGTETVATYFDLLGPRLRHIHMTDSDGVTEDHIVPGAGVAPLGEMLQTVQDRGYDGYITIELVSKYLSDPSTYARLAIDHMRRLERELTPPAR